MSENMDNFILGFITGLNVRGTLHKAEVLPDKPVEAAYYLYGTPSESGNVALADGDGYVLYNGAALPDISKIWDKEAYPYACISANSNISSPTTATYRLCFYDTIGYVAPAWGTNDLTVPKGTKYKGYYLSQAQPDTWQYTESFSGEAPHPGGTFIHTVYGGTWSHVWSNVDLRNEEGTLLINTGSPPIPLTSSEPVGYTNNNIPIYEQKE